MKFNIIRFLILIIPWFAGFIMGTTNNILLVIVVAIFGMLLTDALLTKYKGEDGED